MRPKRGFRPHINAHLNYASGIQSRIHTIALLVHTAANTAVARPARWLTRYLSLFRRFKLSNHFVYLGFVVCRKASSVQGTLFPAT